jgi:mRNA interferase MazF
MAHPNRGEVWLVDLGLAAKVRPCLVLSIPVEEQDRSLVTVIPHTTSPRSSRFEVSVKAGFLRLGVFDAQNIVTIPRAKLLKKLGSLPSFQVAAVEASVRLWLSL